MGADRATLRLFAKREVQSMHFLRLDYSLRGQVRSYENREIADKRSVAACSDAFALCVCQTMPLQRPFHMFPDQLRRVIAPCLQGFDHRDGGGRIAQADGQVA